MDYSKVLSHAWQIIWKNKARGVGGFILSMPMMVAMIPLVFLFLRGADFSNSQLWIVSLVCFAVYLPFLIVFNGIINSYYTSGWTLTFRDLTKPVASLPEPPTGPLPEPVE